MTTFLQLHVLTSYPPANLNRDETGRPKTAIVGGRERLRISSQALKRAWRTSNDFQSAIGDAKGTRTKRLGRELLERAEGAIADEKLRKKIVRAIASAFGKLDDDGDSSTLVFLSEDEKHAAEALLDKAIQSKKEPSDEDVKALIAVRPKAADIAMFGRMLADASHGNVEAAVQVAHAITVHAATVEDDYFSAIDDLKDPADRGDTGSAHIGETGFGAGVFYIYVCVNCDLLLKNLGGDDAGRALAGAALEGLVRAITTVAPKGKQASFGSVAKASYVLAEVGRQQPRALSVAFLEPVGASGTRSAAHAGSPIREAVSALRATRDDFGQLYDEGTASYEMTASHASGDGTRGNLRELAAFCVASLTEAKP